MQCLRRTWAQIDLNAIRHNYLAIAAHCSYPVFPVVKADAYGHGAVPVAQTLEALEPAGFAVSNIEEGEQLRRAGIRSPILILGYTPEECALRLAQQDISQCVYSAQYGQALDAQARKAGVQVKIHLKMDTGMGRIGYDCRTDSAQGWQEAVPLLSMQGLIPEGIFTHFAAADSTQPSDTEFTRQQHLRFTQAVQGLQDRGFHFRYIHCNNSAAILSRLTGPENAVRAGIILYGLAPSEDTPLPFSLRPAMSLYSVISMVKSVGPGESISYGRTYQAEEPRRIATVSTGYADGVPRLLSGRGSVLIRGKLCPIVGRVCMDQFCVDVTDVPQAAAGDQVTLFGPGLPVDQVARQAETIHYEILCGVSKRVPRLYLCRENDTDQE